MGVILWLVGLFIVYMLAYLVSTVIYTLCGYLQSEMSTLEKFWILVFQLIVGIFFCLVYVIFTVRFV